MKKIKIFFAASIIIATFAACDKNEVIETATQADLQQVTPASRAVINMPVFNNHEEFKTTMKRVFQRT